MSSKITPKLTSQIEESDPTEWLNVLIDLEGGQDRIVDIAEAKQEFSRVAQPVADATHALNGDIVHLGWVNHTLRVRLLAGDVATVADLEGILSVDVAQMIGNDPVHEPGDGLLFDLRYYDPQTAVLATNMVRTWRNMPREEFEESARSL